MLNWKVPGWMGFESFWKGSALDNCIGFIDGTCRQICRPGKCQKALYNGHKHYHCLKY